MQKCFPGLLFLKEAFVPSRAPAIGVPVSTSTAPWFIPIPPGWVILQVSLIFLNNWFLRWERDTFVAWGGS